MKKFKFRLEPLLRYREYIEQQKKLEVAKARTDVLTSEQAIAHSRREAGETHTKLETDLATGVDAYQFQLFCNYLSGLERSTEIEKERRKNFLVALTQKQKELSEKAVERKVIGNLKNRQKEAYYTEMMKEEQKELDDTVILRHIRNINK
jgi:flagellar protein FliJ